MAIYGAAFMGNVQNLLYNLNGEFECGGMYSNSIVYLRK